MKRGPQRIYLVRHGESEGNVDKTTHFRKPDHAIELTDIGHRQAIAAGAFLRQHFHESGLLGSPIRLWSSPYKRTRQTADGIIKGIGDDIFNNKYEDISLREQQFGLFDGYEDAELAGKFPLEYAHYKKCEDFSGRFYATMPLGESRCQVAERVKPFFGTLVRDAETKDIQTVVIVSHGVTMRAFTMQWLHLTPEWFEAAKNPKNCSVYLLERDKDGRNHDKGCIYDGNGNHKKPTAP